MSAQSDYFKKDDQDIIKDFYQGLKKINSDFSENDVVKTFVFREPDAQPIVKTGYVKPNIETEVSNFYWLSTHHVYPHDRGIEYAIEEANKLSDHIKTSN